LSSDAPENQARLVVAYLGDCAGGIAPAARSGRCGPGGGRRPRTGRRL